MAGGVGGTARASAARLAAQATGFAGAARVLARFCIDTPELEAKILFARHLHDDACHAARSRRRAAELGVDVDLARAPVGAAADELARSAAAEGVLARVERLYACHKARLAEELRALAQAAAPVADEPSARLWARQAATLERQQGEARQLVAELGRVFPELTPACAEPAAAVSLDALRAPARPLRDRRFGFDAPPAPTPAGAGDTTEARIGLLHLNLTDLEIATIEACARLILDHPDMPWEFVLDMARQCWDEARHAELFRAHLLELGGRLGRYRIAHTLWDLAGGQPLEVRLALHQRIGEWVGVDGALYHARLFAAAGAGDLARAFEFVALDEITHVAFGNKWLRAVAGSDEAVQRAHARAEERRCEAGKSVDGPLPFPFNRWACERAGFTPAEVARLEERFLRHGSLLAMPEEARPI